MIIEMRTYKLKPGKRAEFLRIFRAQSVPAHTEIGMKILGPFISVEVRTPFSSCAASPTWLPASL